MDKKPNFKFIIANTPVTENYYIESGILKCFIYNKETKKEVIIDFLSTGDGFFPSAHYMPLQFNVQVIEEVKVSAINDKNVQLLREEDPQFDGLMQLTFQQMFNRVIAHFEINSYPDLQTRYEKFLKVYPYLDRINDDDIATLLGTDAKTANHIKSEVKKKKKKTK